MWIARSLLTAGLMLAGAGLAAAAPATLTAPADLRAGPGLRYDVIGRLPAGTAVEATICSGDWCRTQYGYVNAGLIGRSDMPAAVLPVDPVGPAGSAMPNTRPGSAVSMTGTRTTIGTVNVRAGAGTDFEIVRTLPDATSVTVQGCTNGWCQIDGGYVSLYVLSRGPVQQVLPPEAQPPLPGPSSPPAMAAGQPSVPGLANAQGVATPGSNATTTANTNVRAGPGAGYERLGTLPAGSPVTIESCAEGWCRTQYGYVSARLVGRAPAARFRAGATRPRAAMRAPTLGYWGARPSYWGGRPSYWRPHPAYPLPERT
ncbi:SH3 domain-containing protein [Ancylobacter defluvii]|uniref:SH3 domain-containing protein n=1 Tax=Ancylobacter defluvii TaxID=1282440 RepID=UPI001BCDD185|nr:SH3 domain-containing protein [Ancylobacter defluvii]MBS7586935.1 SH3 domain-containing protein [Ancylobacter defluvii]